MILKKGSKGEDVKKVQKALHLYVDGIFGKLTEEAVKEFQRNNGLTVDGIVGNQTWLALFPTKDDEVNIKHSKRSISEIILHCSATPEGKDVTVEAIRQYHIKSRGWSDIGYHYVIYRDGSIHDGRDVNVSGAHCSGHNSHSIGICYIGGLEKDGKTAKDTRTYKQKESLVKLVKALLKEYKLTPNRVFGHYQFANKACPCFKIEPFRKEL